MPTAPSTVHLLAVVAAPKLGGNLSQEKLREGFVSCGSASRECVIRYLTPNGACLEFSDGAKIPGMLTLIIKPEGVQRAGNVIWQSGSRVGIRFL